MDNPLSEKTVYSAIQSEGRCMEKYMENVICLTWYKASMKKALKMPFTGL